MADHATGSPVVATAVALSAFRVLPNGEGRVYTATTFPGNPLAGCERFVRTCRVLGYLVPDGPHYAVLDVLDATGDIVQDFLIRDAAAFRYIKRKLRLRVEAEKAEHV